MPLTARLFLLALLVPGATAAAEPSAPPDRATVQVPDVTASGDPKVQDDGYKFYYFHNPAVSFAEAVQDFAECRAYLAVGGPAQIPGFVPWDEAHRRKLYEPGVNLTYGMIGAVMTGIMADIIVPKMERGVRSNKMRRCMGTRGYQRYAIPEATWDTINRGDEKQIILMQAKLATGPKPHDAPVTR